VLGTGEGVDNDCLLDAGDPMVCLTFCEATAFVDREDFGPSSFKPLEGESAENREDPGSAWVDGVERELTELVDVLRKPINETDSLVLLRGTVVVATVAEVMDWRGALETDVAGDARAVACRTEFLGVGASSLSMTPNSLVDKEIGEGLVEELARPVGFTLARRLVYVPVACFPDEGLGTADVRLEIRGILVGVSLGRPDIEPARIEEWSFSRRLAWVLFVPFVPTDGEPAIVGSWVRLRREPSEIFCIELTVWEVTLDETEPRLLTEVEDCEGAGFSLATLWAVTGSMAEICIGGRLIGDLGFRGSVDESVWEEEVSLVGWH
jgi:hypothetical protein